MGLCVDVMQSQKQYQKITRAAYDLVAGEYIRRDRGTIPETFEVLAALKRFISLLPPYVKILDIGSGGGRDSRFLYDHGFRVTGIDSSRKMIAKARKIQSSVIYMVMDLEYPKFRASTFDGVWANASLHHIPKKRLQKVLRKIYTVLKPGGILFVKVKYGKGEKMRTDAKFGKRITRYFAFYRLRELNKLLCAAGFKIIAAHTDTRKEWIDVFAQKP